MLETYGSLENVAIITLAPEKDKALEVIKELTSRNITVSLGHSMANLTEGNFSIVLQIEKYKTHCYIFMSYSL